MTNYEKLVETLRWTANEYKGSIMDEYDKDTMNAAADAIEALQAEVPKRGEWIYLYDGNYKCSVCGEWYGVDETPVASGMNYCPNCGAKMEVQDGDT